MDVQMILEKGRELLFTYGLNFILSLLILFLGLWASKLIRHLIGKLLSKRKIDQTLGTFISNLLYGVLVVFVVIAALSRLGIQTASLVAVLGAAGLAIGLALQGSLGNFAAGVLLIALRPFKIGDYIEGGGTSGSVGDIGMFTTTLTTPDNKVVTVPNTNLTGDRIINYTAKEMRRMDLKVGVSYDDDIHKVSSVLKQILDEHPNVLKDPAYTVGVFEFADSSVNFVVRPWVKTVDYWVTYFDIHAKIKDAFDSQDITIPYPQRDVYLHQISVKEQE